MEDIGGVAVRGYRAATFSVGPHTPWAWPVLEEEGYRYTSSIYPVVRDNYANPDAPRSVYRPVGVKALIEIPIATVRLGAKNYPCGGGGYFRLLPYSVSRAALARVNRHDRLPAVFYIHPWEVDPDQPRANGVSAKSRFRHYVNLSRTGDRLRRLTRDFRWGRMDSIFLDGSWSGRRPRPAMLLPDTSAAAAEWDALCRLPDGCSFFHLSGWRQVVKRSFGHDCPYLRARQDGALAATMPLTEINSRLFGHFLIGNGFTVGGGPLFRD